MLEVVGFTGHELGAEVQDLSIPRGHLDIRGLEIGIQSYENRRITQKKAG